MRSAGYRGQERQTEDRLKICTMFEWPSPYLSVNFIHANRAMGYIVTFELGRA